MSFIFLKLYTPEDKQEAFLYRHNATQKYHISGFLNTNKEYKLSFNDETSLLTLIDLFFTNTKKGFVVSLYCIDKIFMDKFLLCASNLGDMQVFLQDKLPRITYEEPIIKKLLTVL